jgi:hypothetical protein
MRDQEIIGLHEAYNQVCRSSEILSENDEMEQNPLLHLTYAERAKRLKDKAEQIRRKKGKTRTEEIELDEEAPERIRKSSKNPRLMKDAGPARVHNPKKENQKESYDLFDYILEYLVAEGYADTNQNALVIMANMSEDWRQSIVEESKRTEYLQKKFNKENERKSGSALKHIPGKQNTGQALQKARESERHMRGEK